MLHSLHIENYILIDSLDVTFPEGLVIITGQTGAGKSILLGALSLCLGAKADAAMIGSNGDSCIVEAEFEAGGDTELQSKLSEDDLPWQDGHLVIRRVVHSSGRSRSFLNDEPVSVSRLQEVSSHLVDVHSQHQTLLLQDQSFRRGLLDHYAGNEKLLEECSAAWSQWQNRKKELASAQARLQSLEADREYTQARYKRLEEAELKEGELFELEERQKQLAHAEDIKEVLSGALVDIGSEDFAPRLKDAVRRLEKGSGYMPFLSPLAERLESARLEIEDISAELESASEKVDVSPMALQEVEDRMSLLYDLMKRYGVKSEAELIQTRDSLSLLLSDGATLSENLDQLKKDEAAAARRYGTAAQALHKARTAACDAFSSAVLDSLRFLELENGVFKAVCTEAPASASGTDTVDFLFSSNGKAPADVAKCASGGELSRIMLSLKAMMAKYTAMPTMVFDEIDTGVSGSAADKMGSLICSMGGDMQVFAITHLPQVAAKGSAHYLVTKEDGRTGIVRISGEDRVMEISRMLSGSRITEAAIENARVLISES